VDSIMLVYQSSTEIDPNQCFLCKPISNKFPNYVSFYKISYNLYSFTLNSLLIWIDLKQVTYKEHQNQYVLYYTMEDAFIERMLQFERIFLGNLNQSLHKKIQYTSYENKNFFYSTGKVDTYKLFIRISGIWESETHIGLTSKVDIYPSS